MLSTNGTEPSTGNWGWVGGALAGIAALLTAIWHRATRRAPRIPTQNAAEVFERLGYVEASTNRAWSEIEGVRVDVSHIKRDMVSADDLQQFRKDLLREIAKMLENRA